MTGHALAPHSNSSATRCHGAGMAAVSDTLTVTQCPVADTTYDPLTAGKLLCKETKIPQAVPNMDILFSKFLR
jgi:hypothetical protein